jgi:hypothetical protein
MVDCCVETEIRELSPKSFVSLPKEYWDNKKTTNAIFQAIAAASDQTIKTEQVTCHPFHPQTSKNSIIFAILLDFERFKK